MSRKPPPPADPPSVHAHTRARIGKNGVVFMTLVEVGKLPVDERRPELLKRLEHLWKTALERHYTTKDGDERPNPDVASALRVVEVADAMLVEVDGKQQKRANLAELTIFQGGKRTG